MKYWGWIFVAIAVFGLLWHGYLTLLIWRKANRLRVNAEPLTSRMVTFGEVAESHPTLAKPALAIDTPLDAVITRRLKLLRQRNLAKAARERRLIENLKKIDPTERRFIRVRKRS